MRRCKLALSRYANAKKKKKRDTRTQAKTLYPLVDGKRGEMYALNEVPVFTLAGWLARRRRCSVLHALYRNLSAREVSWVRYLSRARLRKRKRSRPPAGVTESHEVQEKQEKSK